MVAIPKAQTIPELIYAERAKHQEGHRRHLGASLIGDGCARKLWYIFRWAQRTTFSGRMLRLFERGQREEAVFCADLRSLGIDVYETDPETGAQFRVSAFGGHFGGSIDGLAIGIPEAPKTWHITEFKTHNAKSFAKLEAEGVQKAKPQHYAQMQIYMGMAGHTRALYMAVNKDTDELYAERVRFDQKAFDQLVSKAEYVITSPEAPARLSDNPAWFECKWCDLSDLCHLGNVAPEANCRTCCHSTPTMEGEDGRWSCAHYGEIPKEGEAEGCGRHCFIPSLLWPWVVLDATDTGIVYDTGKTQIEQGPGGVDSATLSQCGKDFMEYPVCVAALEQFPGAEVERG